MEELFEAILALIAVAVGVALKNSGKKIEQAKARRDASPANTNGFDWDQIERPDVKPAVKQMEIQIPYVQSAPEIAQPEMATAVKTAVNAVAGCATPVSQSALPVVQHPEGCHSEEGPTPGCHPKKKRPGQKTPRKANCAEAPAPAMAKPASEAKPAPDAPGRVTAAQLRRAVVMSEVLGRPVALRGGIKRL